MHTPRSLRGGKLLAMLLMVGLTAPCLAADTDESKDGFTFRLDPVVLEVLETDLDTNSSKFEEYRDLGSGFRMPELRIVGQSADGDRHLKLIGHRIARQDASYQVSYGLSGRYRFDLDYRKIPHRFGNDATLLWDTIAPGRLTLADPIQTFLQSEIEARRGSGPINFDFLAGLVVDIALRRDRTAARLEFGTLAGFSWGVEFGHENRDGNRAYGGSFGFLNVTEIPEPISYDTTSFQLDGEWNGKRGGVQLGYRYSRFENHISTLIWDNPFRITDSTDGRAYLAPGGASIGGSATGFADLAPDNEASQFFISTTPPVSCFQCVSAAGF